MSTSAIEKYEVDVDIRNEFRKWNF